MTQQFVFPYLGKSLYKVFYNVVTVQLIDFSVIENEHLFELIIT